MQLFVLALAQGVERDVVATDQAHELLRIHFMTVPAGMLLRHRGAMDIVRLRARLLDPGVI
ncbi:hypothetical protein JQ563_25970 [Bradyrhizobium liaoningense]|nr:hypothetical protein [Bradyrhizobium liaoningense]